MINAAGGCGKTFMIKKLNNVILTATTSVASELINGVTINSYILKNKVPNSQRVVIDECSMMGSLLFEQVYEWSCKGNKKAQLIFSGDFLQLPPVNDRFLFQSSSFYTFAKNCVMIKLTEVKR